MKISILKIKKKLRKYSNKKKAAILQRFFKTGPGEYAEGDVFIGATVPCVRKVAEEYEDIGMDDIARIIRSPIHEERMLALLILVSKFKSARKLDRKKIYEFYLDSTIFINNWDLVDLTAHHIVGDFLKDKDKDILYKLAGSGGLWERRISIVATFCYIKESNFKETLKIAQMLINDRADLIHKAVGWMLREVGKRDKTILESFLNKNYKRMPRTTLRYAIEKFPESKRQRYLMK